MKRLAILFIAVVCTAMFIAPAFAEDRLALSGSFRVRAWDTEDFDGTEANYFDQRLRTGAKLNVADDVNVQFRADWGDGTWGQDYTGGGLITRPRRLAQTTVDVDRAFLEIKKEMWSLRAGQQYLGLGVNKVLDANATGIKFDLNFAPVVTSFIYAKMDENGSLTDEGDTEDEDFYALNINYSCDNFTGNVFVAAKNDDTDVEDSPVMVGFEGAAKLGMVNLTSELAIATGDTADGTIDYIGTQFYLAADTNVTDTVNIGARLFYALGTDDPTERQFTTFANFGDFDPISMGTPFDADLSMAYNVDEIFDPTGDSAGVQGIMLETKFTPVDVLALGAKVAYLQPEEDSVTDIDSLTAFHVWAAYTIATNTELAVAYLYSDPEMDDNVTDLDPKKVLVTRLQIAF